LAHWQIDLTNPEYRYIIRAIKLVCNWDSDMRLHGVVYNTNKELYKIRVTEHGFRYTIRLEEKLVRHAINHLKEGGKAIWI
jgi:hypothetical protein